VTATYCRGFAKW